MGTVTLAIICVVVALALSVALVFMELKRRKGDTSERMWARLNGLDPDDSENQQWFQEWRMNLRINHFPQPRLLQRLWMLLGVY
jgi:hypothetical protein